ncbi:MAG: NAAT family transporter [Chloroflexi bacterium]|nr:NAAT family transporter [Chloroflexota bacterium]
MIDFVELTNWNEYTKLFIGLFALVSPPIIVPLFMSVVGNRSNREKKRIAMVGSIGFAVIMLLFTFLGKGILNLFGVTIPAFRIAGGLLLLLMSLDMMRSDPTNIDDAEDDANASAFSLGVVPLAVPILAGPGAISTLIIMANLHDSFSHQILVAIVLLVITVYIFAMFQFTIRSGSFIGKTATIIFFRVMGLMIAAIAIEFILDGLAGHFPFIETIH